MNSMEDQIEQLQDAKIFSTLDLQNGFFHVQVEENSKKYTAFITPNGHYEFVRVPFGLCNSPAIFQRFINKIFKSLCALGVVCIYMDDLVIPAKNEEEAIIRLSTVLNLAEKNGLQINWSKCQFLCTRIEYLGYEIENGCVYPSKGKKEAILKFPEPNTLKKIQSFLGLTGYFRKFVQEYAIYAKPLSDLLRKDMIFQFGPAQKHAFEKLKEVLVQEPVLRIYSTSAETQLHTDACKIGLGAILLQKFEGDQLYHPVFYYSRKTSACEERYSSYELEVLAIVKALKKFRVYLLGLKFFIVTDCAAFKYTMEKKELTSRIAGWALQLQKFDYTLEHRPSHRMKHVDALSRSPVVLTIEETVTGRIKAAQKDDEHIKAILELLNSGPYKDYVSINGILFKSILGSPLIVVPRKMQAEVIRVYHEQGHFSVKKTEELVERQFFITKLREKIQICSKNCIPCILAERKTGKQDGLLNPIPKGDVPLNTYYVDHLGCLVATKKQYKYILCVIDCFTKFVWLYPTKSATTKETIAKLELQKAIFGNPDTIISDRGPAFRKEFDEYCNKEGIKHFSVTVGMPSGNGQVERINRIIIPALTKLAMSNPEEWYKYVDKFQRYLNNSYQRSIDTTPFQLLTGVKMRCPEDVRIQEILEQEAAVLFDDNRAELREAAKRKINAVQAENRKTFNRKRRKAPLYNLRDWVVIKRTQFSSGNKICPKYLGPYEVTAVKERDRYDVRKVSQTEGPSNTTTSAELMKPYYYGITDDDSGTSEGEDGEEENDCRRRMSSEPDENQDGRVGLLSEESNRG